MRYLRTFYRFAEVCLILALCVGLALAQSNRGTLAGTVLDSSGSAIAGATVTAIGAQTGIIYKATSNSTGGYRIGDMQIGVYDVTVEAQSFKKLTSPGITVDVNTTSARDFTLQPGGATEIVTVNGDLPNIESETADVGTIVTQKQILELPLALGGQGVLRSPEAFVFLTPGTTGPGSADRSDGAFQSKLAGGQNFGTEVLVDGASTVRADSGAAFDQTAPSVEALTEFKVTTSTLPAEFGRTTGGVESFTTRSGTNSFHGSIYDIFRNEALNANSWLNDSHLKHDVGQPDFDPSNFRKTVDKKNDFGGTFGGPVWIPKIYNGRNKTFFFFSWEQYLQQQGGNSLSLLPNDAMRNGDFSAFLGDPTGDINPCTGQPVLAGQIFDPATTRVVGGKTCRDPFVNNQIDPARISSVATNFIGLVPEPTINQSLPITSNQPNFVFKTANPVVATTTTVRVDHALSEKDKVFFSYSSRENTNHNGIPALPVPLDFGAQIQDFTTHYIRVGWDRAFSTSLLNHLNLGYNRVNSNDKASSVNGTNWDQVLGISGVEGPTFPVFTFDTSGGITLGSFGQFGQPVDADDVDNGIIAADSITWTRGRHTLRLGFDWRYQQFSVIDHAGESGSFEFSPNQTSFTPGSSGNTGNSFASFLLGQVERASSSVRASQPRWISNYYAGYAQDDFKVSRTLMLNLGVRYDVETPRHEALDNASMFSPTTPNPGAGGLPGALIFAGKGAGRTGHSSAFAPTYMKDVAPRIGFAYAPDRFGGKMAFRGGYGIYYGPLDYADFGKAGTLGFTASPQFGSDGFAAAIDIDNGFPSFAPPPNLDPSQANGGFGDGFGGLMYIAHEYSRPAMIQNWSLEIQRDLGANFSVNVGYVGQHATHLRSTIACVNCTDPSNLALGSILNQTVPFGGVSAPFPGFDGTVGNALRPFPQYHNINTDCCLENLGQSTYHALLTKLERRFHSGLNVLASYTWSKTLTNADSALPAFTTFSNGGSAQNPFNLKNEKDLSFQDIPHTFVLSYIYELPLGRNKKFLNHGGAVDKVVGGWQVGAVHRYQSGQPLALNCVQSVDTSAIGFDTCFRYDRVAGQPFKSQFADNKAKEDPLDFSYLNAAAVVDPNANVSTGVPGSTPYRFGDMPRVTAEARTPLYLTEDFSIIKRTPVTEGLNVLFKAELLNAFNRHVFGRPDSNPASSTYGRFGGSLLPQRQVQFILRLEF